MSGLVSVRALFPAWVVRCSPGSDLALANCCAAFELDRPEDLGLARLNEGRAYLFEAEFRAARLLFEGSWELAFEQTWSPGFDGYHEAGRASAVQERHRWNCHRGAVRVLSPLPLVVPGHVDPADSVLLVGARVGRFPWGAWAVDVGGVRIVGA